VEGYWVQGAGCWVQGAGCRVQGAGCRLQGGGYRVQGAGCRLQGGGYRFQGAGCMVQGAGCRVQGAGCNRRVQRGRGDARVVVSREPLSPLKDLAGALRDDAGAVVHLVEERLRKKGRMKTQWVRLQSSFVFRAHLPMVLRWAWG